MATTEIFISSGDPSGDNATAHALEHLTVGNPELRLFGLGGAQLKRLGQEQFARPRDLAVMGFWEVAKRYWFFRSLMHRCVDEITKRRPKLILLVDYPGFNLRLAKRVKHLNIPIVYYISPQVWAWGKRRVPEMRRLIDRLLVILPFEKPFFESHGLDCEFVGHYLVESINSDYIATESPGNKILALLPGSRPQEIDRMLPTMVESAKQFASEAGYTIKLAGLSDSYDYDGALCQVGGTGVEIEYDAARKIIFDSDLVLASSGTATLETAIIGRPMVVMYRTGWLTYQIAKRLVTLDSIALANLVLGEKVVPELIQEEANPQNIVRELSKYDQDDTYRAEVLSRLHRAPELLGGESASEQTANVIREYL